MTVIVIKFLFKSKLYDFFIGYVIFKTYQIYHYLKYSEKLLNYTYALMELTRMEQKAFGLQILKSICGTHSQVHWLND